MAPCTLCGAQDQVLNATGECHSIAGCRQRLAERVEHLEREHGKVLTQLTKAQDEMDRLKRKALCQKHFEEVTKK